MDPQRLAQIVSRLVADGECECRMCTSGREAVAELRRLQDENTELRRLGKAMHDQIIDAYDGGEAETAWRSAVGQPGEPT